MKLKFIWLQIEKGNQRYIMKEYRAVKNQGKFFFKK